MRILSIASPRMMSDESKQLDQHVVELVDLPCCRLFRLHKQAHVAGELRQKLHFEPNITVELFRLESTDRSRRHFEHLGVQSDEETVSTTHSQSEILTYRYFSNETFLPSMSRASNA